MIPGKHVDLTTKVIILNRKDASFSMLTQTVKSTKEQEVVGKKDAG